MTAPLFWRASLLLSVLLRLKSLCVRPVGVPAVAAACALLLQGCAPKSVGLLNSSPRRLAGSVAAVQIAAGEYTSKKNPSALLQLQQPEQDESSDSRAEDSAKEPGPPEKDPGGEMEDEGDIAEGPPSHSSQKPRGWASVLYQEDHEQQHELQDEYNKMLYLDDPDAIDRAMRMAWDKMAREDRAVTRSMLTVPHRDAASDLDSDAQFVSDASGSASDTRVESSPLVRKTAQTPHKQHRSATTRHHRLMLNARHRIFQELRRPDQAEFRVPSERRASPEGTASPEPNEEFGGPVNTASDTEDIDF